MVSTEVMVMLNGGLQMGKFFLMKLSRQGLLPPALPCKSYVFMFCNNASLKEFTK